jgi:hypothetical protein
MMALEGKPKILRLDEKTLAQLTAMDPSPCYFCGCWNPPSCLRLEDGWQLCCTECSSKP